MQNSRTTSTEDHYNVTFSVILMRYKIKRMHPLGSFSPRVTGATFITDAWRRLIFVEIGVLIFQEDI